MTWVSEGMEVYRWEWRKSVLDPVPVLCVVVTAAGHSAQVIDVADGFKRWVDVQALHTIEETAAVFQDRLSRFI